MPVVMNCCSAKSHPRTGLIYSLESPPIRPALSARSYVSRFSNGSSPVASVVAMYSRIRRWASLD